MPGIASTVPRCRPSPVTSQLTRLFCGVCPTRVLPRLRTAPPGRCPHRVVAASGFPLRARTSRAIVQASWASRPWATLRVGLRRPVCPLDRCLLEVSKLNALSDQCVRPRDEEIFERDRFMCVYCDFDASTFDGWTFLQVDHFKPRSRGGTDCRDNLVTSCIICNHMKGAFEWNSVAEARGEIAKWRQQMNQYWCVHVQHRVPSRTLPTSTPAA